MRDVIATFNAGSSSLKLGLFDAADMVEITRSDAKTLEAALALIQERQVRPVIIGHRIVHGGERFGAPVRIDDAMLQEVEKLIPLAPLHLPPSLELIARLREAYPDIAHIACFDTAFHATLPALERTLPLPPEWAKEGVRRYGFHGLSYSYIASVLPGMAGTVAEGRVVVAHLGSGASLCAMQGRQSIATTMGLSALDGLMMGTRSGTLDPGVVLYMLQEKGMDTEAISQLLYHEAGLQGLAGSHDMRELEAAGTERAEFAIALFCYQAAKFIAEMAVALQGIDALVFTGGIGEHSSRIRTCICQHLGWMGITLDKSANAQHALTISAKESNVNVLVIATNEEKVIAEACQKYI